MSHTPRNLTPGKACSTHHAPQFLTIQVWMTENIYKGTKVCVGTQYLSILPSFFFLFLSPAYLPSISGRKTDWFILYLYINLLSFSVQVYSYSMPLYMMLSNLHSKNTFIIHLTCQPVLVFFFFFFFLRLILEQPNLFPFFLSQDTHHIYFTWSTSTVWSIGLTGINICVDCLEKAIWKNSLTAWKWIGSLRSVWPVLFSIMFVRNRRKDYYYFWPRLCNIVLHYQKRHTLKDNSSTPDDIC